MKRTALILLTAIYLVSTLGVAANGYYCCGKLQATTIIDRAKQPDCKMAAQMKGCCKTKKQYFKISDRHFGAPGLNLNAKLFAVVNIHFFITQTGSPGQVPQNIYYNGHAPPNRLTTPAYILNCTYRI